MWEEKNTFAIIYPIMEEGKRQKQIASVLQEELNDIFQRKGLGSVEKGMVSIAAVKITPDLLEARVYLSFFQVSNTATALKKIEGKAWEIKKELAGRVKHQLRRIPDINYFIDDSLEQVFKMEALLKKINEDDGHLDKK
jgi:ribosome-binding factor A